MQQCNRVKISKRDPFKHIKNKSVSTFLPVWLCFGTLRHRKLRRRHLRQHPKAACVIGEAADTRCIVGKAWGELHKVSTGSSGDGGRVHPGSSMQTPPVTSSDAADLRPRRPPGAPGAPGLRLDEEPDRRQAARGGVRVSRSASHHPRQTTRDTEPVAVRAEGPKVRVRRAQTQTAQHRARELQRSARHLGGRFPGSAHMDPV